MHDITRSAEEDLAVLRVAGTYDQAAALELRSLLNAETRPRLLLDFRGAAAIQDSTLPMLVVMLALHLRNGAGRSVRLVGLRGHQEGVLHYFGVDLDAQARVHFAGAAAHPA